MKAILNFTEESCFCFVLSSMKPGDSTESEWSLEAFPKRTANNHLQLTIWIQIEKASVSLQSYLG